MCSVDVLHEYAGIPTMYGRLFSRDWDCLFVQDAENFVANEVSIYTPIATVDMTSNGCNPVCAPPESHTP